jgi:hypothetical protein
MWLFLQELQLYLELCYLRVVEVAQNSSQHCLMSQILFHCLNNFHILVNFILFNAMNLSTSESHLKHITAFECNMKSKQELFTAEMEHEQRMHKNS